eukprot:Skav231491  [mRNA]  locus=scaffold1533:136773:137021:- [translate_table: standard]
MEDPAELDPWSRGKVQGSHGGSAAECGPRSLDLSLDTKDSADLALARLACLCRVQTSEEKRHGQGWQEAELNDLRDGELVLE